MSDDLIIRSVPLDLAVQSVCRLARRCLAADFDVLDYSENAPVWRLVGQKLGRRITLRPRQRRLPLIGPWDLARNAGRYQCAYVLGTGPLGGLDQVLALAREAADRAFYYDPGADVPDPVGEVSDIERIDAECRFVPESARPVSPPQTDIRVIRIDLLGDLVYTIPLLTLLKEFFPSKRLSLLVDERHADVASRIRAVDQVETIGTTNLKRFHNDLLRLVSLPAAWQLLPIGGGWRRDLAAYLHAALPAVRKISRMEGAPAGDLRYVHASWRREVVEVASMALMMRHSGAFDYGRDPALAIETIDATVKHLRPLPSSRAFRLDSPSLPVHKLAVSGRDVILAPLGGSSERDWHVAGWAATVRHLLSRAEGRLLLLGDDSERQTAFNSRLKSEVNSSRVIDLSGQTDTDDLLHIAGKCGGYLGANTAPMHLVALQGKRTIALNSPFESADTWRYPFGKQAIVPGRRFLTDPHQPMLQEQVVALCEHAYGTAQPGGEMYNRADIESAIESMFREPRPADRRAS